MGMVGGGGGGRRFSWRWGIVGWIKSGMVCDTQDELTSFSTLIYRPMSRKGFYKL